jgi:general secretion pathway protein H
VALSLGSLGPDREIKSEMDRLESILGLLHEESLMQSRDYGVMFTTTGYRFFLYDYQRLKWLDPQGDKFLEQHALRPRLGMELVLDGRQVALVPDFEAQEVDNAEPQVMVLSSGEMTPFTVEMSREGAVGRFVLTAELNGNLKVSEDDFDSP